MPQDNIVELVVGATGDLVTGTIFIDYTHDTISGPGLFVLVNSRPVALTTVALQDHGNGTYTILGSTASVGGVSVASVNISLSSQNPPNVSLTSTINGVVSTRDEVVVGTTVCFASGTLIATDRGNVAVESLVVGDRVLTSSGVSRPIKWLGHRTVKCKNHPRPHEAMPVCIAAHAFGDNRPTRDLYVSAGHSICVDHCGEVLIAASALINGSTVRQVEVDEITYWHVELDSHDIIFANGLPAESYLEMGNRCFFADGGVVALDAAPDAAVRTHADFCRPYHDGGPLVERVKELMRERAHALGWTLSSETDLHLVVDGRRRDPVVRGTRARFELPADVKDVWLVSPAARPCDTLDSLDVRDLGLQIGALRVEDGLAAPRIIAIDDPRLCIGFYGVEDGAYRWTTGRARLPAALWEDCEDGFYLCVELAGPPVPGWRRPPERRPQLALVG